MTVRMTGAEFVAFYLDEAFWDGGHFEDADITIGGIDFDAPPFDGVVEHVKDSEAVRITNGVFFNKRGEELGSFESIARRWKKQQKEMHIAAVIPKEKLQELRSFVVGIGGRLTL